MEMWVHQSVDWSKNVSPEVGEGGGQHRDSKQGRNSLDFRRMVHSLWYGCLPSLREMKWGFPDLLKINPSFLFKLLRWSSNSVTSMMSQSI